MGSFGASLLHDNGGWERPFLTDQVGKGREMIASRLSLSKNSPIVAETSANFTGAFMSQDANTDPLVIFTPSGKRGNFPVGTPVLTAARQLGVDLDSVCGGRGICSK